MKYLLYLLIAVLSFCSCNILGQSKPIGEIPFTLNKNGTMMIQLSINHEKISNFILDTGASVTILDDDIAEFLKLKMQDKEFNSIGASGVSKSRNRTTGQQISITEKVQLKDIPISVTDLSHLGEVNGITGFDLFRNYVSKIDFDKQKITFYKKKGRPDTEGYLAVNFVETYCTPEVDISFTLKNGEVFSGKALFDTGNTASPLIVNSPYKSQQNLLSKFESLVTLESRGINSESQSVQGVIKSLKIGDFELGEMPISLSNTKEGVLSWEGYLGLLGLNYISKFNFIIDYHRKYIYLKPNSSFSTPFEFPLSGIKLKEKGNEIFIKSISKPSAAYEQGLRKGQKLISINGIKRESIDFYRQLLKNEGKEAKIIVKLENGELKSFLITLKRLI